MSQVLERRPGERALFENEFLEPLTRCWKGLKIDGLLFQVKGDLERRFADSATRLVLEGPMFLVYLGDSGERLTIQRVKNDSGLRGISVTPGDCSGFVWSVHPKSNKVGARGKTIEKAVGSLGLDLSDPNSPCLQRVIRGFEDGREVVGFRAALYPCRMEVGCRGFGEERNFFIARAHLTRQRLKERITSEFGLLKS